MENNFSRSTLSKLKVLGIYQIAGGIVGMGLSVWLFLGLRTTPVLLIVLILAAIALNIYSIYCGALVYYGTISGLDHSLVNQSLQILSFTILGFTFQYNSGIHLYLGLDLTNSVNLLFNLGVSSWLITINGDSEPFIIQFNLVAFFLLIFIIRFKRKIRNEQMENQLIEIGQ